MRLDKLLTYAGLTRQEAKRAIAAGRAVVNGVVARDPGMQAEEGSVLLDGRPVSGSGETYLMLNKPAGVLSATEDSRGARTVLDLVPPQLRKRNLGPVGRLDKDVTGLMLLTTDGQLAHRLISPRWEVEKVYIAHVEGLPDDRALQALREGVPLKDFTAKPARARLLDAAVVEICVTEGKYHQVKRMLSAVGHPVLSLKRISVGGIPLDEGLLEGEYRELTKEEIHHLKALTNLLPGGECL